MLSRRKFLSALSAFPLSGMAGRGILEKLPFLSSAEPRASASDEDLTKFVKIAIGTGGHGPTYPGATVPFGMVQPGCVLTPLMMAGTGARAITTRTVRSWDFSHTHLSGTGASDMLDFLLMPGTGPSKIYFRDRGRTRVKAIDRDSVMRKKLPSRDITR